MAGLVTATHALRRRRSLSVMAGLVPATNASRRRPTLSIMAGLVPATHALRRCPTLSVMAGLVPATHALRRRQGESHGVRNKHGHAQSEQTFVEILPLRIETVDESHLPGPRPMFYVFLSLDGIANIVENFVIDQQLEPVTLGETLNQAFA